MARTPKPLEPAREEQLLLVAARHFAAAGYAGTSLNTVIAEADWGKSSFYHYFSDKRRLHDHVVRTLAGRLTEQLQVPDLRTLSAVQFWPAMTELAERLDRASKRRPETRLLGEMFHHPADDDDGQLQEFRAQVEHWLRRALAHGRKHGVIRNDLPEELLAQLTLAVLRTLDHWAVHNPRTRGRRVPPQRSIDLIRDLIAPR
ncbi:TetR/AcrR family transcriptional regulator [Kribbella sp. NBC_01484]|uniref:TetR/AcrR family transcriptional regulator n=1 Tax=Kribbella sp. NBC_01484 TaxID=2903579 RepID=UPI002E2F4F94|nr:TetR/AcrR family transcriptional regulator [Kribbella sp. NBC_01484]